MQGGSHTDVCPMTTGCYPVAAEDWPHGLRCSLCTVELKDGDSYVYVDPDRTLRAGMPVVAYPVDGTDAGGWKVGTVACLGCGAMESANA